VGGFEAAAVGICWDAGRADDPKTVADEIAALVRRFNSG
jgi:hypothetical protein